MSSVGVDDHYTGGCAPAAQLQEDDLTLRQVSTRSAQEVGILKKGIEVSSIRKWCTGSSAPRFPYWTGVDFVSLLQSVQSSYFLKN